jgi:hypothetical protein
MTASILKNMHKHWLALACIALGVCLAASAHAGVRNQVTAVTVTTTSGNCLANNNSRMSLTLDASAATANIGYCEGGACTAAAAWT